MSRVYARFYVGLELVRVEIPPRLQRFAKRTNCWIDFDADGFTAGHAKRALAHVYGWNRSKLIVEPPRDQAEVRAIQALCAALGVDTARLEALGVRALDVESDTPYFTYESVTGEALP